MYINTASFVVEGVLLVANIRYATQTGSSLYPPLPLSALALLTEKSRTDSLGRMRPGVCPWLVASSVCISLFSFLLMYQSGRLSPQIHSSFMQLQLISCLCYMDNLSGRWNLLIVVTQGPRLTETQFWHVPLFSQPCRKWNMAKCVIVSKLLPAAGTSHFCSHLSDQKQSNGRVHIQRGLQSYPVPELKGKKMTFVDR